MKKYIEDLLKNDNEFNNIIYPIIKNETVQEMKNYKQHYETSCFEHCLTTSYYCYKICKKFNLDYKSASKAAMLHDLFLYDWRKRQEGRKVIVLLVINGKQILRCLQWFWQALYKGFHLNCHFVRGYRTHSSRYLLKVYGKLFTCHVIVESKVKRGIGGVGNETMNLPVAWVSSCGDKDCRFQITPSLMVQSRFLLHPQLIEGHGIIGTLEDKDMLGIFQVCSLGTGHPYSFACIAACRHSFSGCAVLAWITSFLESNTSVWLSGNVHGKGEVLVDAAIFVCLCSKYKTIMKGTACGKIYPSGLVAFLGSIFLTR